MQIFINIFSNNFFGVVFDKVREKPAIQPIEISDLTSINTNVGGLSARASAVIAARKVETSMERLSSGLRVNSAADDAAGLAVAGKMESQLRGINMAIRNSQDGVGLIQTGESGLNEIRNMVLRIRELAVQMANGIYENTPDRANAQLEVAALLDQVDLIAENTRFNNVVLLDGSFTGVTIQAGNTVSETIALNFISASSAIMAGTSTFAGKVGSTSGAVNDTGVTQSSTSGSGSGATFDVAIDTSDNLTLTPTSAGTGYGIGDTITINGSSITGGVTSIDDIVFTITGLGLGISNSTVATQSGAIGTIATMDGALETIASEQAKFGSLLNRLSYSVSNLSRASVMTEQAVGRVLDADFAFETASLSKWQILNQAATAMLSQANQSKQSILVLVQ